MPYPAFLSINPDTLYNDLTTLLDHNRQQIKQLTEQTGPHTWESVMAPLDDLDDALEHFWSPISHLHSVMDSPALRAAYLQCIPPLTEYSTEISHNRQLFDMISSIKDGDTFPTLSIAQQKIINDSCRDFKLAGVTLSDANKKTYTTLCTEISELTTQFENNVLDATQAWHAHVVDDKQLAGIPDDAIIAARALADTKGCEGWLFSLEFPSYFPVITYCEDRSLRESMYRAYTTRASDQGPNAGEFDNSATMLAILKKRQQLAKLLDFKHYSDYSLATKMVKKTNDVMAFLESLAEKSVEQAKQEFSDLAHFAENTLGIHPLQAWDIAFTEERLRQAEYDISQETLRPYFPETTVLPGLFTIAHRLFNITIKPTDQLETWHEDVKTFAIFDHDNKLQAYFYCDLYARTHKRGGAWMDECQHRRLLNDGHIQTPIAFVNCNFNAPVDDKPACFTHNDVVTLFHEFGHALQHMLTKVDYLGASGISGIPWDAVELPSQCLENWAYEREGIAAISAHVETQTPLPDDLYNKMIKAKNFHSGMQMVRQLEFSLFDFRLHQIAEPTDADMIQACLEQTRQQVGVIPTPAFNRFQHGFTHIFSGGYAAGYYSYKWAEVMAADAFALFKEKGAFDSTTAEAFKACILEAGGSEEPIDLFKRFRGREPDVAALLLDTGIMA